MSRKSSIAIFIVATSALAIHSSAAGEKDLGGLKEWNTDKWIDANLFLMKKLKELPKRTLNL